MPAPFPQQRTRPGLAACRSAWARWLWLGALAGFATAPGCKAELCEPGLCPAGTTCNPANGQCEAVARVGSEEPTLFGRTSLLRLGNGEAGVVGYAPRHKSLVLLTGGEGHWQANFIAGPRAASSDAPAGQASAATVDAAGQVHVAWVRSSDATLWYASGGASGWQRDPTPLAPAGTVGRDVAIGIWQNAPLVAWRAADIAGIRVARRAGAQWTTEVVPVPPLPGKPGAVLDQGRSLSLAMLPSGPGLVSYEATGGDLVLAVRGTAGWQVARIAGRNQTTGEEEDDSGATAALAAGPAGELAVAYRDRTHDQVLLARSKTGVLSHQQVASGLSTDGQTVAQRPDLIGTALAVAVLADGRAVVAVQNASNLRIDVAVQTPAGAFEHHALPGNSPQAWPVLRAASDGSVQIGWIDLQPGLGPGGRYRLRQVGSGVAP